MKTKNAVAYVINGHVTWLSPEQLKRVSVEFATTGKVAGAHGKVVKPRRATTADVSSASRDLAVEAKYAASDRPLTFGLFASAELAALAAQLRKENTVDLIGASK
jgi:hypothetical protein